MPVEARSGMEIGWGLALALPFWGQGYTGAKADAL